MQTLKKPATLKQVVNFCVPLQRLFYLYGIYCKLKPLSVLPKEAFMLFYANGIEKTYNDRLLFKLDEFVIYPNEKIGLIGANGAGKSTLLKIISGEVEPDNGYTIRYCNINVITQLDYKITEVPDGKFAKIFRSPREYAAFQSGGEKTRLKIASGFSGDSGLLLADEPTTNLDINGIELVKHQLQTFSGSIVLISHDQKLLNEVCNRIVEIENGKIINFQGNYQNYLQDRERLTKDKERRYEEYRQESLKLRQAKAQVLIQAKKLKKAPSRMGNSEARLHKREAEMSKKSIQSRANAIGSRLEHLEKVERPQDLPNIRMAFSEFDIGCSKHPVYLDNINLSFQDKVLLKDAVFEITRGSKTALFGDNGSGKTTFLNYLMNHYNFPQSVTPAYFSQDFSLLLAENETVIENAKRITGRDETIIRTVLARLLIKDVNKKAKVLSGGEQCKICIGCILLSKANFIILDEPTNHLDLYSIQALADVLSAYPGTLLFVTHDRYFAEKVADNFLIIEDKKIAGLGPIASE